MSDKRQWGIILSIMNFIIQKKVDNFFSRFERKIYKKGETIISPDEAYHKAFYIKSGYVRNYSISAEGIEITLHIFTPGSYFPMMSVLSDVPNRYYYDSLIDTEIIEAPKDKVIQFLKSNPDILLDLTTRLLKGLDKLSLRIEYLALETAHKRLASALVFLARHFGEKKTKEVYLKHIFTHRDIAAFAGISRETTSREMEKLRQNGVLSIIKQRIVIHDSEKLTKLSRI